MLVSVRLLAACISLLLLPLEASALQYARGSLAPPLIAITATGPIIPGDSDRLRAFVKTLPQSKKDLVLNFFFDSPGGNIVEAEKIAAYVHETAASVTIPNTSQCASACFLIFAAAKRRFMGPDALIGVHSVSQSGDENLATMAFTTIFARQAAAYGVPPAILGKMVQTEPGRMAWLTPTDLRPMGVVVLSASSLQLALPLQKELDTSWAFTHYPNTTPEDYASKAGPDARVVPAGRLRIGGIPIQCDDRPTVANPNFDSWAGAYPNFIILNIKRLAGLPKAVQFYAYTQSCGYTINGGDVLSADCFAIKKGVSWGWLNAAGLEQICWFISQLRGETGSIQNWPAGPARCAHMRACFADAVQNLEFGIVSE